MSPSRLTFLMPAALALVLGAGMWWLWPADSDLWRKVIAVFLSMALGFQVAVALRARGRAAAQAWLECGAFLLVQGAFLHLPSALGWLLLLTGWCWRFLVRNLWRA